MRLLLQREKKVLEIRNLVPRQNHLYRERVTSKFLGWGRGPRIFDAVTFFVTIRSHIPHARCNAMRIRHWY